MNFEELWAFAGRNPVYSIALAGLTVAIIANELSRFFRSYRSLRPAELVALVNRENALVVDLRAAADYQKGHIAGSKNVLMNQFDPEGKHLAPAKALPVVLVCQNGVTVTGAAKRLKQAGFQHVHIHHGPIAPEQGALGGEDHRGVVPSAQLQQTRSTGACGPLVLSRPGAISSMPPQPEWGWPNAV